MKSHYRFIDIAKGIGIIFVVASHVFLRLPSFVYPILIPIFFVASGYCTKSRISIKKKAKSLLIPYFAFSFLLLVLTRSFSKTDLLGVLYSRFCLFPISEPNNVLFLTSCNSPLWFFTCMFLTWICVIPFQRVRASSSLYLILLYLLITRCGEMLPILLPWSIDTVFLMALYVYFGIQIRENNLLERVDGLFVLGGVILYFCLCPFCGEINVSVREYGESLWMLIPVSILGCFLILKLSLFLESIRFSFLFEIIGRQSLWVFSLHYLVLVVFRKFCSISCLNAEGFGGRFVGMIVCILIPIAISMGISRLVCLIKKLS